MNITNLPPEILRRIAGNNKNVTGRLMSSSKKIRNKLLNNTNIKNNNNIFKYERNLRRLMIKNRDPKRIDPQFFNIANKYYKLYNNKKFSFKTRKRLQKGRLFYGSSYFKMIANRVRAMYPGVNWTRNKKHTPVIKRNFGTWVQNNNGTWMSGNRKMFYYPNINTIIIGANTYTKAKNKFGLPF